MRDRTSQTLNEFITMVIIVIILIIFIHSIDISVTYVTVVFIFPAIFQEDNNESLLTLTAPHHHQVQWQ